jgi:hypothetical protein
MIIVDLRSCGRTRQRDSVDNAMKGCDGSIADRRVPLQVAVECGLLFAQPVENVSDSLWGVLEVEADDGVVHQTLSNSTVNSMLPSSG